MPVMHVPGDPLEVKHWGENSGRREQALLDATAEYWVAFDAASDELEQCRLQGEFLRRYGVFPVRA